MLVETSIEIHEKTIFVLLRSYDHDMKSFSAQNLEVKNMAFMNEETPQISNTFKH